MAKKNVYHIYIENKTDTGNSPIAGQDGASGNSSANATSEASASSGKLTFAVAYRTVKSFVAQSVNNEIGKVQLRTGSARLQEKANFINQVVQTSWNFGESIVAGAMFGGLPGAIIGGTISALHTIVTYANNQNVINLNRSIENQSRELNYIRAGAQGSR